MSRQRISDHFQFDRGRIIPLTPVGRATAQLLNFNDRDREELRRRLWLATQTQT
jgi:hypothetical protein